MLAERPRQALLRIIRQGPDVASLSIPNCPEGLRASRLSPHDLLVLNHHLLPASREAGNTCLKACGARVAYDLSAQNQAKKDAKASARSGMPCHWHILPLVCQDDCSFVAVSPNLRALPEFIGCFLMAGCRPQAARSVQENARAHFRKLLLLSIGRWCLLLNLSRTVRVACLFGVFMPGVDATWEGLCVVALVFTWQIRFSAMCCQVRR